MPASRRRAIGLMSGTSIDAIDVALVETDGEEIAALGPATSIPYAAAMRAALRAALGRLEGCEELGRALTAAHAAAVASFLEANGIARDAVDVVGFHGHTLAHRPDLGRTRQLGDPAWLARALGIDVVGDFRQADVAAGGQGAPLAPIYHARPARPSGGRRTGPGMAGRGAQYRRGGQPHLCRRGARERNRSGCWPSTPAPATP